MNTSSAAPATWPLFSAATSAASSTSSPRAQLMMRTPFFIVASVLALMMPCGLRRQAHVQREVVSLRKQLFDAEPA